MKPPRVELPSGQNWSCHGCTNCCRHPFVVQLTAGEKRRIEQQRWTEADGVDPTRIFTQQGEHFALSHRPDGACVFLAPSGACRIHAKFGADAKPLPCRFFPFVIHPAGKKLVLGLRFSCPSTAANRGQPLSDHEPAIRALASEVVPASLQNLPPPAICGNSVAEWPDFLRFLDWIDTTLKDDRAPLALKLQRALYWLRAIEKAQLTQITGPDLDEVLEAMVRDASRKLDRPTTDLPSRIARVFLRLQVLEHARSTTTDDLQHTSRYRRRMLGAGLRFAAGFGSTPAIRSGLERVPFAAIEAVAGPLPPELDSVILRFLRLKLQGLQFCGRAFHGVSLVEGFRNLALLHPTILWLARWRALSQQRTQPSEADVVAALTMVDEQYGLTPYLAWRHRLLTQRNDIGRLCTWMS